MQVSAVQRLKTEDANCTSRAQQEVGHKVNLIHADGRLRDHGDCEPGAEAAGREKDVVGRVRGHSIGDLACAQEMPSTSPLLKGLAR
jgi:hypothetical protein